MIRNVKEKAEESVEIAENLVAAAADLEAQWVAEAAEHGFKPRISLVDFAADLRDFANHRKARATAASADHGAAKLDAVSHGDAAGRCHTHVVRARSTFRNRFGTAQTNECFGKGATPEDAALLDEYAQKVTKNLTSKTWTPVDPDVVCDPAAYAASIEKHRAAMNKEEAEEAAKRGAAAAKKGGRDDADARVRNGRNGGRKLAEGAFLFLGDLEGAHRVAVHHHASPTVTEAPVNPAPPGGGAKPEEPKK